MLLVLTSSHLPAVQETGQGSTHLSPSIVIAPEVGAVSFIRAKIYTIRSSQCLTGYIDQAIGRTSKALLTGVA